MRDLTYDDDYAAFNACALGWDWDGAHVPDAPTTRRCSSSCTVAPAPATAATRRGPLVGRRPARRGAALWLVRSRRRSTWHGPNRMSEPRIGPPNTPCGALRSSPRRRFEPVG